MLSLRQLLITVTGLHIRSIIIGVTRSRHIGHREGERRILRLGRGLDDRDARSIGDRRA